MEEHTTEVRQSLCDPEFLRNVGAAWKLLFFLMLQVEVSSKSYSAKPDSLATALGVSVSTLSSWVQRLQALKILRVSTGPEKVRLSLLPPLSQITLVSEEGMEGAVSREPERVKDFDESTTDILLRKRSGEIRRIEDDIDFIFSKMQSLDLRLSALEGSYAKHQTRPKTE